MIKLDKRLKAIVNLIPSNSKIIDVGCDHGKVCVYALQNDIASFATAVDISSQSLNKAKLLANECGVENIKFVVSDGLKKLKKDNNSNVLIIAGMGANEIIKILNNTKLKFEKYIFTPHQDIVMLRKYLITNGFKINKDFVVKSNKKFYSVMDCELGQSTIDKKQLYLGQSDLTSEDYIEFLKLEEIKIKRLLQVIPKNNIKAGEYRNTLNIIEGELSCKISE